MSADNKRGEGVLDRRLSDIATFMDKTLQDGDTEAQKVGWKTDSNMKYRYAQLIRFLPQTLRFSVNDLGSGLGLLFDFLEENGYEITQYTAYDISSQMCVAGEQRLRLNKDRVTFHNSSICTKRADFSFASGIFNTRLDHSESEWKTHVFDTIRNLAEFSIRGFAINSLTNSVDFRENHLFYMNPSEVVDFCNSNVSRKFQLLQDYDLFEWTLAVSME